MTRLRPENIFEKLNGLTGSTLNVVLKNGKTYFGSMVSVNDQMITILDTRRHSHKIFFTGVYEIICDYETTF